MSRRTYEAKRNLAASSEPRWHTRKQSTSKVRQRHYVIQKHAARRLHFDLRLEVEGALASWAVPKGIPVNPGDKHLAIKVEDHPLDYAKFEGNIPPGNYGAGTVMLWDRGLYEVLEKDPASAIQKGHLSLVFAGEKLQGDWLLVRTRSENDKEQWLLIKGKETPTKLPSPKNDHSVASGRTLDEIAEEAETPASPKESSHKTKKRRRKFPTPSLLRGLSSAAPKFATPMKPHLTKHLPKSGEWIYEIKFDGYRFLAVKDGEQTTLFSRTRKDISHDFSTIRDAVAQLPVNQAVLDGEIVALLESGLSSFQLLQNRARSGDHQAPPMYGYVFDLLQLEGRDTTGLPLHQRKEILQKLLTDAPDPLRFSANIETDPETFLAHAQKIGLEGILAKEKNSRYLAGRRSRSWLKLKLHHEQEFVIGGYTQPKGSRSHFGAILLGVYEGKNLHYVGRAGSGFDENKLESLYRKFQKLRVEKPPFSNLPSARRGSFNSGLTASDMKRCVWLKPSLVCQVRFSEWTSDNSIRHPVFLALRDDKPPRSIVKETATET